MTGYDFGGELFLLNLDVIRSPDHTCMHNQYHKKDHQTIS